MLFLRSVTTRACTSVSGRRACERRKILPFKQDYLFFRYNKYPPTIKIVVPKMETIIATFQPSLLLFVVLILVFVLEFVFGGVIIVGLLLVAGASVSTVISPSSSVSLASLFGSGLHQQTRRYPPARHRSECVLWPAG